MLVRAPEAKALVEGLHAEHAQGAALVRELERSLVFFEDAWPGGAREFLAAVEAYAEFHWKHMRKEEDELLPLAERCLEPEDWKAIDAAFAANSDPIAGMRERDFDQTAQRWAIRALIVFGVLAIYAIGAAVGWWPAMPWSPIGVQQ